jgi:hypothetical protein
MNTRSSLLVLAIVAVIAGLTSSALAQGYRPPAGPTITPYLDYFNAPVSPLLENYHTYVRPRAELRSNLNQLGATSYQQDYRLNQLGDNLLQTKPSKAAPTGTGSTFMNYSHYYSGTRQHAHTPQRSAHRGGGGGGAMTGGGGAMTGGGGAMTGGGGGFGGY